MRHLIVMMLALVWFGPALAAPAFPPLTGRVVDTADMIDATTEIALTNQLAALEKDKGIQFVVATIPSLDGNSIEQYGYQLGRHWAIGRKDVDDGVILLVAQADRKVRIEVGYGLTPVLTAGLSGIIISDQIVPKFKEGDFDGGIKAGSDAIIAQLRLPAQAGEARAKRILAEHQAAEEQAARYAMIGFVIFVVIMMIILFRARRQLGKAMRSGGAPVIVWGGSSGWGGGDHWGGGSGGGFSGGGFSGGGGSFGGGGASGGW